MELGIPVAVIQNQFGFILGWHIMWTKPDSEMTVPIVMKYTEEYETLSSISFGRGYWSQENYEALCSLDVDMILLKNGYKSKDESERDSGEEFQQKRRQYAMIESCITVWNSMEGHAFGPKEGRLDLRAPLEQAWWQ